MDEREFCAAMHACSKAIASRSVQACYVTIYERVSTFLQDLAAQQQQAAETTYALIRLVRCPASPCCDPVLGPASW